MKKKTSDQLDRFKGTYKGFSLKSVVHRQSGLAMLEYPSRIEKTLYYPDGQVIRDKV